MEEQISIGEIINIFKKKMGHILISSFLGLLIAGVVTFFFVTPSYQSTSKIVVNQTQNTSENITNTDIQTNLNLINTYQSIIKEPIVLEEVIQQTGSSLTTNELKNKITIQTEDSSLVFGITVTDDNPFVASELANAAASVFQQKIGDILEVTSVTILSTAAPSENPVSPNTMLNLVAGLLAGMIFGSVLAVVSEMSNKIVKDEKIIETLGWTNLGSVLEMSAAELNETRIISQKAVRQMGTNKVSRRRI